MNQIPWKHYDVTKLPVKAYLQQEALHVFEIRHTS